MRSYHGTWSADGCLGGAVNGTNKLDVRRKLRAMIALYGNGSRGSWRIVDASTRRLVLQGVVNG